MAIYNTFRQKWSNDYELETISFPEKLKYQYYNRTWKIMIFYYDKKKQKTIKKTVHFGNKRLQSLVQNGKKQTSNRKKRNDIFHPYFWEENILNKSESLIDNFIATLKLLKLDK